MGRKRHSSAGRRYRNRRQTGPAAKRRATMFFAIFLGFVGVHRFTLGQWHLGLLFIFMFVVSQSLGLYFPGSDGLPWATLAAGVGYFEALRFYRMSDEEFAHRYLEEVEPEPVRGRYLAGTPAPHPRAVSAKSRRRLADEAAKRYEEFDYQAAAELYEEALDLDLADGEARVLAARCYSLLEQSAPAYRHLRRAVQLRAGNLDLVDADAGFAWLRTRGDFADRRRRAYAEPPAEQDGEGPPALPARADNVLDQLEQLGRLRNRGLLDDEEFAREKRRLLR